MISHPMMFLLSFHGDLRGHVYRCRGVLVMVLVMMILWPGRVYGIFMWIFCPATHKHHHHKIKGNGRIE